MIIDFNNANTPNNYLADICIIGSGAAALAMLTRLYNSPLTIIVLEAGGEKVTQQNQQLYDVITPFHPFNGARDGRFRVFGGSTVYWGGQSLPLDKIDFTERDWVPLSGWPISYGEVAKYYSHVDDFLNVHKVDYEADIYQLIKNKPLPYHKDLALRFSKWSPTPNLREKYRKEIGQSKNITLIQNANLTRLDLTDNLEHVHTVQFRNFSNKTGTVKAKKFILACGGIENARLLLASNHQLANGVGNAKDNVGRYLQDHPIAKVGQFVSNTKQVQSYFNYFYIKNTRFLPRFILSENFQKSKKLLNASAFLKFETEEKDAFSLAKEVYRKQVRGQLTKGELKTMVKLVKHLPEMLMIGKKYFLEKKVYTPSARIELNVMVENIPLRENRVALSDQKDALGMPKSVISWKIDQEILDTFKECTNFFKGYLDYTGLGYLQVADWVNTGNWHDKISDSKHHIGTTRMSNSPKDGVVDTNCKVHDISNLYIAGSSVFPTSGHSNPTSTIIALAFRLADHLKATAN